MKSQSCDSSGRAPSVFLIEGVVKITTVTGRNLKGPFSRERDKNIVLSSSGVAKEYGHTGSKLRASTNTSRDLEQPQFPHWKVKAWTRWFTWTSSHRIFTSKGTAPCGSRPAWTRWVNETCCIDELRQGTCRAHLHPLSRHPSWSEPGGIWALPWRQHCCHPIFEPGSKVHFFASAGSNWAAETKHHSESDIMALWAHSENKSETNKAALRLQSHASIEKEIWKGDHFSIKN